MTNESKTKTIINESVLREECKEIKKGISIKKLPPSRGKTIDYDELYFKKDQKEYYKRLIALEKKNSANGRDIEDFQDMKPIEWRQGKPLGQGSYGFVYEAFDLRTNKTMAVKKVFLGG